MGEQMRRGELGRESAGHLGHGSKQRQSAGGIGHSLEGDRRRAGLLDSTSLLGVGSQVQIGEQHVIRAKPGHLDGLRFL